jgi:hypothetical protein
MLILFSDIKGTAHKEFLLAGQTVSSTYYSDVLQQLPENTRRRRPELWGQKNYNMTVNTHPPYFSLFPLIEAKTARLQF